LSALPFERMIPRVEPIILIADDSATIRGFVKLVLRGLGTPFQLIEAEDGELALVRARTTFPILALIDLHMPNLDGLGALKALRAQSDPRLRDLPVLLLTAERGEDLRAQCMASGANGFLDKPIKQPQLLEAVRRYLAPAGPK
jgi:two-component system chemotaxis response regulator CheY